MAFDAGTITAFFKEPGQMGLYARTHTIVAAEGIVVAEGIVAADDMSEFTKDGLETVFQNLRKPPKTLVIPTNAGVPIENHPGIPTKVQPYIVSTKSKM